MKYRILEIFDEDYGCEGIAEGEEPYCNIALEDCNGKRKIIKISEKHLVEMALSEGDVIDFPEKML